MGRLMFDFSVGSTVFPFSSLDFQSRQNRPKCVLKDTREILRPSMRNSLEKEQSLAKRVIAVPGQVNPSPKAVLA